MAFGLGLFSFIFALIACERLYWGLSMQVMIPVTDSRAAALLGGQFDGIANLGLMHNQAMLILMAVGAAIVSAILAAAAAIIRSIEMRATEAGS